MATRDKNKKDINLTNYDISKIQKLVTEPLKIGSLTTLIGNMYKISLNELSFTQKDLHIFSARLHQGWFSNNEMVELMKSCIDGTVPVEEIVVEEPVVEIIEETKIEIIPEQLKSKTRTVTELKVGDIVHFENLKHPFLILNIYKSGLFKAVSLSTKPDSRQIFALSCRFLETGYVILTISINEIEEFKSKWIGNISLSQVKLVKLFLKQNKL